MTASPDEAGFFAAITAALGRDAILPPSEPAPGPAPDLLRTTAPTEDLPALFAARAAAVGMHVQRHPSAALPATLAQLLATLSAHRVTLSLALGPLLDATTAALAAAGVERILPRPDTGFADHYAADAGITDVAGAIAETGSLVLTSGAHHSRATYLVPPVHIALVRRSQLVPDLVDYFPTLRPDPAATVLITGPSKTADIEGVLVTGVHGPAKVHILLLDDL